MSFSLSLTIVPCPRCGEPVMPYGAVFGQEPVHRTATCSKCGALIEVERDPETGKLTGKIAIPS